MSDLFKRLEEKEAFTARRPTTMRGVVETLIHEAPEFTVASFRPDGQLWTVRITGPMPGIAPGMELLLQGQWTVHPKYGEQFKVKAYALDIPRTTEGLTRYLGSGTFPGIGPATADKIVQRFGLDTLDIMDTHIDRLLLVKGMSRKKLAKLIPVWGEQRQVARLMTLLMSLGAGPALAARIYKEFGNKAEEIVKLNPYQLTQVRGVGFLTADRIAQSAGIPHDAPARIEAGIVHALGEMAQSGHTCAPREVLAKAALELLGVEMEPVQAAIDRLVEAGRLCRESEIMVEEQGEPGEALYLPWLHHAESEVADRLLEMAAGWSSLGNIAYHFVKGLSDRQMQAVRMALTRKVGIVTGGPGTGKTYTTRTILDLLLKAGIRPTLAAPTGRAAKRMTEMCDNYPASTIHRLLGAQGPGQFQFNQDNPLPAQIIILDEFSMVDVTLFHALLQALPSTAHLIIVGDADQLPSVGPGRCMRDLCESGALPVVRLDTIFRQAEDSSIITNAHRINRGVAPLFPQDDQADGREDFFFFSAEDQAQTAALVVDLVARRIPQKLGVQPTDIQVLSPLRRNGEAAANPLNTALQAALNPARRGVAECRVGERTFRVGDRVIQTKNDYTRRVFNGETGQVVAIDTENRQLVVAFDDMVADFAFDDLENLDLAYALTVHKSQGSEYPVVIIPVVSAHYIMLKRNLLYTGVTRARQVVVLVGQRKAVSLAVSEGRREKRFSGLKWRLGVGK